MYSYAGGRVVRLLPIISFFRSLSPSHEQHRYSVSLSLIHTSTRTVEQFAYISLFLAFRAHVCADSLSPSRSHARMAAGLVAIAQPFRIAVFAGVVRCGRVRVLV